MNFTFGADIEFFLKDKQNKYLSAFRILKGTKEDPEILDCKAGLHWDNVAVEFASVVTSSEEEFLNAIKFPIQEIRKKINPHRLVPESYASFPEDQLVNLEEQEFACVPDFDAWKIRENATPIPANRQLRSCGGHIHIGYVKGGPKELLDPYGKIAVVKMLDIFLGVPFVLLDRDSMERRKLYGKAGCHRPTGYGVEYRTLSNFWTRQEETIRLVYRLTKDALRNIYDVDALIKIAGGEDEIVSCINEGNLETAKEIIDGVVKPRLGSETKTIMEELNGTT